MAKITLATVKSFIKKNPELFIREKSRFDGMSDCVMPVNGGFTKAEKPSEGYNHSNTLGIRGAWFVGDSRDRLSAYEDETFIGFHIYNCCGSFDLAVRK